MSYRKLKWKWAQYLELKWWQRYLRSKSSDEYVNWKKNYWIQFAKNIEGYLKNASKVLEIGCGPAGFFLISDQYHFDTYQAIDPLVDQYKIHFPFFNDFKSDQVVFHNTMLEKFDVDEQFDLILGFNAINHFQDLDASLERLKSLLKNEGCMLLSVDIHNYSPLHKVFKWIPGDMLHPQQLSLNSLAKAFSRHGLRIEQHYTFDQSFLFRYEVFVCRIEA